MHSGWNRMVQTSKWSTFQALLNPYNNCKNRRLRNLTFLKWQCENRANLAPILENRCSAMIRKVIGEEISAQRCTIMKILPAAIDELACNSWSLAPFLLQFAINRTLRLPAREESIEKRQKQWWILGKLIKKWMWNLENFERICEFLWFDLKNGSPFNSFRIKLLYCP